LECRLEAGLEALLLTIRKARLKPVLQTFLEQRNATR
jgi:hypothetical protein